MMMKFTNDSSTANINKRLFDELIRYNRAPEGIRAEKHNVEGHERPPMMMIPVYRKIQKGGGG